MWEVLTTDRFDQWFTGLNDTTRQDVLAALLVLKDQGPMLGRPYADTLYDSGHSNMKELRIQSAGSPLRAFFAFDPERKAIVLCAGNKAGNEKRFYKEMIPIADAEFQQHLDKLNQGK